MERQEFDRHLRSASERIAEVFVRHNTSFPDAALTIIFFLQRIINNAPDEVREPLLAATIGEFLDILQRAGVKVTRGIAVPSDNYVAPPTSRLQ